MTRRGRIAVEILGPPVVASALFALFGVAMARNVEALSLFPFMLIFAFLLAGLPSLAFAAVLELAFARGLDPRSGRAVLLAAVLGTLSGAVIVACIGRFRDPVDAALFAVLGLLTGGAVGLVIRAATPGAAPPGPGAA